GGNGFWVGHPGGVSVTAVGGKTPDHDRPLPRPMLFEMKGTTALAVDPKDRALWGFAPSQAMRYQSGKPLRRFALPISGRVSRASIDGEGAAWIGDDNHLLRVVPEIARRNGREVGVQVIAGNRFAPTLLTLAPIGG